MHPLLSSYLVMSCWSVKLVTVRVFTLHTLGNLQVRTPVILTPVAKLSAHTTHSFQLFPKEVRTRILKRRMVQLENFPSLHI